MHRNAAPAPLAGIRAPRVLRTIGRFLVLLLVGSGMLLAIGAAMLGKRGFLRRLQGVVKLHRVLHELERQLIG